MTYQWALTMYIVAGTPVIDEGFASTVQEFYKHPEYKKFSTWHDIAMLYLRLTIPEDKFMKRIYQATDIEMGVKATISGYGILETPKKGEPAINPRVIQYLHVKVIDNISCAKLLPPDKVFNHTFCTISPKFYGPCHGNFIPRFVN